MSFDLAGEYESLAEEFAERFPHGVARVTRSEHQDGGSSIEIIPVSEDACAVTLHAGTRARSIDIHIGTTADFELKATPWNVETVLAELRCVIEAVAFGNVEEEIYSAGGVVYKGTVRVMLPDEELKLTTRAIARRGLTRRHRKTIRYAPW